MKTNRIIITGQDGNPDSYIEHKVKKKSYKKFPVEEVKRNAFGILNLIRPLSSAQRERVLNYAIALNSLKEGSK